MLCTSRVLLAVFLVLSITCVCGSADRSDRSDRLDSSENLDVLSIMEQQLGRPIYLHESDSDLHDQYSINNRPIIVLHGRVAPLYSPEQPIGNTHLIGPTIGRDRHFVLWQPDRDVESPVVSMTFSGVPKWWRLCLVESVGLKSRIPRAEECNPVGAQVVVSFESQEVSNTVYSSQFHSQSDQRYAKFLFHDSRLVRTVNGAVNKDANLMFGFVSLTIVGSEWYTLPRHAVFVDDSSVSSALRETVLMSGKRFVVKGLWRWRLGGVRSLETIRVHKKEGSLLNVVLEVSVGVDLSNHVWAAVDEVAAGHVIVGEGKVLNTPPVGQLRGYQGDPFVHVQDLLPVRADLESVGMSVKVWMDATVVGCLRLSLGILGTAEGIGNGHTRLLDGWEVDLQEHEFGMI